MARKISTSQLRSKLRQIQNKQKQAVNQYNREVRKHNQKVKRAVEKYNSEVRKYNSRVRANRQKINTELSRLRARKSTTRYKVVYTSAISLNAKYDQLDSREGDFAGSEFGNAFLDLSERENANSLRVSNALESDENQHHDQTVNSSLFNSKISDLIEKISPELNNRWKGALFSLNPENPDAARHFCTSAREVFIQILDINAPDGVVLANNPGCDKTDSGKPIRREKIKYMLAKSGISIDAAVEFVSEDVDNVLSLFRVFNDGTHGTSGRFGIDKLLAIKTRVEDGISYLASICGSEQ